MCIRDRQWGRDCKDLPAFIIRRLPLRFTYDNNYFNDRFQGIPEGGYTQIVEKLLEDIPVLTGVSDVYKRQLCALCASCRICSISWFPFCQDAPSYPWLCYSCAVCILYMPV